MRLYQFHGNDLVIAFQLNSSHASRDSSHRSYIVFRETNALAVFCNNNHIIRTGCLFDIHQLIAFF